MKLAIFADIHGNFQALKAVLDDLEQEKPDIIICAGDLVNPYSGSTQVWEVLKERQIPMLKGNHEEYVIKHRPRSLSQTGEPVSSVQFLPALVTAQNLPPDALDEIEKLPFFLNIAGPEGKNVFICHASPSNTRRSYAVGIDKELSDELLKINAAVIVSGHIHEHWQQFWQNKLLLLTGSVGLPFNHQRASEYLILHYYNGSWHAKPRLIPYNHKAAVRQELANGLLKQGGPIAWLMFDELYSFQMRLAPFMDRLKAKAIRPTTYSEWEKEVQIYLDSLGRWQEVKKLLKL
jgi:predicted phosphodiesterase